MINFNNGTLRVQGKWLYPNGTIPKVDLPPYTMLIEYLPGVTPWNGSDNQRYLLGTARQVSVTPNIWEWHYENSSWSGCVPISLIRDEHVYQDIGLDVNYAGQMIAIHAANLTGVYDITHLAHNCPWFYYCAEIDTHHVMYFDTIFECDINLTRVPNFDLSNARQIGAAFVNCRKLVDVPKLNIQDVYYPDIYDPSYAVNYVSLFSDCKSLTQIPILDYTHATSTVSMFARCTGLTKINHIHLPNVNKCGGMFRDCVNVESGALKLYQELSALGNQIDNHEECFKNCGINTSTGLAELQQIPQSWGGLAAG